MRASMCASQTAVDEYIFMGFILRAERRKIRQFYRAHQMCEQAFPVETLSARIQLYTKRVNLVSQ